MSDPDGDARPAGDVPTDDADSPARDPGGHAGHSPIDDPIARAALDPAFAAVLDAAADRDAQADAEDRRDDVPPPAAKPAPTAPAGDPIADAIKLRPAAAAEPAPAPLDPGHPEFQAIFRQSVLDQIRVHAEENPGIEVCGVVVGTVFDNPQAAFVYVDGMIRGESSAGRSTQVTFTAETWQHIHKVMEERHPGKRIIGWYHTHPGFGVFLSEMDLFIQRNFFNAPWQMAFVYDPRSHDAGAFAWRQAQVRRVDFVLDDESGGRPSAELLPPPPAVGAAAAASAEPTFHEDPAAPVNAATLTELADRVRVLEARVKWMLAGFAILALVAIIWPLVVTVVMPQQQHAAPAGPAQGDPQQPAPAARPGQQDRPMLPLR